MIAKYEEYFKAWLEGIYDEISYWKELLSGKRKESERLTLAIDPNKRFTLEEELPCNKEKNIKFVDIGSGPYSRCGKVTNKVKLDIIAVDPLAEAYKVLKKQNDIENGIKLETGFVELLEYKFKRSSVDIVHMSNALDHSFDAIFGIYQMLYICKIGGKVILRHHENEAEAEKYKGLHQWNLSVHNEENSFVIWRPGERYDICKIFYEYADILIYPDIEEEESGWTYNKIVMIKKKDIAIPSNNYRDLIFKNAYAYLMEVLVNNVLIETGNSKSVQVKNLCQRISRIDRNKLFLQIPDKRVIIYGIGIVGQKLFDFLSEKGIEIVGVIDRKRIDYRGYQSLSLYESAKLDKDVVVIVTIPNEFNIIKEKIYAYGWKNIASIEALF